MDLVKMVDASSVQKALDEIEALGRELALAEAKEEKLEIEKKTVIAQDMKLAENKGVTSAAGQEREALAGGRYLQWVKDWSEANEAAKLARNAYFSRKLRFEAWRTIVATERTLANLAR